MALFLIILLVVAVAFGFVGALVKGLLWLLVIGVVLFIAALVFAGVRLRRAGRPTR